MSEENENLEAPNWLSELEKKRERRLKARLGHEAGAGAPCIQCNESCPGLDLHFWRKICKNCKCSKEDHDVHDDDIYGWAQFQLLGSKPNKIKKKIILPGKKDEVELDWAPKGNSETIDLYLKTLAPENLPVKGSQAAQTRKQLLQKQIPIHDIDPTLCHELTDSEMTQMQDYIKHMKNSAGVGQVIQFGINYGEANAKFIANRYPKGIPSIETVQLLGEKKSSTITKQLEKLGVKDQQELDAFFDKIPNPHNMAVYSENIGYAPPRIEPGIQKLGYQYAESQNLQNPSPNVVGNLDGQKRGYVGQHHQNPATTYEKGEPATQKVPYNYAESGELFNQTSSFAANLARQNLGYVKANEIPADQNKVDRNWSATNPTNEINRNLQNTGSAPSRYAREHILNEPELGYVENLNTSEPNYDPEINRNSVNLPHYAPGRLNIYSDKQNPTAPGNIRDVAFSPRDSNVDVTNSNYKSLQTLNPNQRRVQEDQLVPSRVNVGAIRDITYEGPEIKSALHEENQFFEDPHEVGRNVIPEEVPTKQCRKCTKWFEPTEFAIHVEKANAVFHSDCFKCAGCNQSLADHFYFYDKDSDNIYCGRDFAKIRGIPRCKACDELIFVKEYCLAENSTFHLKHFCCFECDQALAGQNYVLEDSQPVCLPCYEKVKANKCVSCSRVIGAEEEGVALAEGIHFHANDGCFCCQVCSKPLRGSTKMLFKNNKLYCSPDCFRSDK